MDCIEKLLKQPMVARVRLDMCRVGMASHWQSKSGDKGPVLKPTGMMSNSWCLQEELSLRCRGGHQHVHLVGGRASAAQEYPRELCEAICRGIAKQKRLDPSRKFTTLPMCGKRLTSLSSLCRKASMDAGKRSWPKSPEQPIGSYPKHWSDALHDNDGHGLATTITNTDGEEALMRELNVLMCQNGVAYAYDDVSNAALIPDLVNKARKLEMELFADMGVYTRVDRSSIRGKIIKTRWIDVNKGDSVRTNYRSRLVGKEFKTYADDSLYASTPPLEATRLIMSRAATDDGTPRELMVNDVARAYFHAKCTRDIYIELPEEDEQYGVGDVVGKLNLCLYGTRDAATNWQETLSSHLVENGFSRGIGFPSVFHHEAKICGL